VNEKQKIWLIITLLSLGLIGIFKDALFKNTSKTYPNFNVNLPYGYTVHGIDISRYQKEIDWNLVSDMRDKSAKIDFVIIKATEGLNIVDKQLQPNWHNSSKTRLIRGVYHYFHANKDGEAQAKFFIKNIEIGSNNLAPVIDIEETQGVKNETLKKRLQDCLNTLQDQYDCKPIIYCNVDFYNRHLGEQFDKYPLWAAHYQVAKPNINREWQIWQHSDNGHVNGIDANVDFNTVNGGLLNMKALCIP
jgi:lysozyme